MLKWALSENVTHNGYFNLSLTSCISLGFLHDRKGPGTGLRASAFFLINCLVDLEYNGIFLGRSASQI